MRNFLLKVIVCAIFIPNVLFAWLGSILNIGIDYPSDHDVVEIPFTVRGWCWNINQDVDYYGIQLIEDTSNNPLGGITPQDYANRKTIHIQNNFNQPGKTNLNLTPRYHVNSDLVQPNKKYYMFIYAVDMNGDFSTDTNIIGLTYSGDYRRPFYIIRYFTTKGYRP